MVSERGQKLFCLAQKTLQVLHPVQKKKKKFYLKKCEKTDPGPHRSTLGSSKGKQHLYPSHIGSLHPVLSPHKALVEDVCHLAPVDQDVKVSATAPCPSAFGHGNHGLSF